MGKLKTILGMIGIQIGEATVSQQTEDQAQEPEIIVDGILNQEPGTMTTFNTDEVSVVVVNSGKQVEIAERPQPTQRARPMGGEEIQPGTLH